jgi:DNA-binding MarR family transcriptional regulator
VPTESGQTVEVATVGREAAVGFHSDRIPAGITQAVVQIRGRFDCLAQADFRAAARDLGEDNVLERLAASCQGWLLLQAQQMAACNTLHSADARFCRWLLRASDSSANEIVWGTQETIAEALCVRRTTVTQIAQRLERAQIISYSRGKITVRDRAGLAAQSCRCPVVLTDQLNHLMPSHGGAIAASLGEEQPGDGVSCCA